MSGKAASIRKFPCRRSGPSTTICVFFSLRRTQEAVAPCLAKCGCSGGAANFACHTTSRAFGELGKCKNRLITLKTWDDCNWQGMTLLEQFSYLFDDNVVSEVWEGRAEPVSDTGRLD
jgi:hypothetical protein